MRWRWIALYIIYLQGIVEPRLLYLFYFSLSLDCFAHSEAFFFSLISIHWFFCSHYRLILTDVDIYAKEPVENVLSPAWSLFFHTCNSLQSLRNLLYFQRHNWLCYSLSLFFFAFLFDGFPHLSCSFYRELLLSRAAIFHIFIQVGLVYVYVD